MNKEAWEQLSPKEKDKLIEERLTGKAGNYSRDWNAAMWLIKYIATQSSISAEVSYDLLEEIQHESTSGIDAMLMIANWTPDFICYLAIHNLDLVSCES